MFPALLVYSEIPLFGTQCWALLQCMMLKAGYMELWYVNITSFTETAIVNLWDDTALPWDVQLCRYDVVYSCFKLSGSPFVLCNLTIHLHCVGGVIGPSTRIFVLFLCWWKYVIAVCLQIVCSEFEHSVFEVQQNTYFCFGTGWVSDKPWFISQWVGGGGKFYFPFQSMQIVCVCTEVGGGAVMQI
jgi:hypothetical protein